jgi:hypothetical protein
MKFNLRSVWALLGWLACCSAKNFGPEYTPLEFLFGTVVFLLAMVLLLGGPFMAYHLLRSPRWHWKALWALVLLFHMSCIVLFFQSKFEFNPFTVSVLSINVVTLFSALWAVIKLVGKNV